MATFTKRGKTWRTTVCVGGIRKSSTHDTKAQAKEWASRIEIEMRNELITGVDGNHTLKEAIERYRDTVTIKKRGQKWETIRLNKFIRTLPFIDKKITKITSDELSIWRDETLKTLAPASVIREMGLISSVFDAAKREWKWVAQNPFNDIKKPTKPAHRDRLISQEEIDKILTNLGYSEKLEITIETKQQEIAIVFLFALETAMRAGEICDLKWENVFLEKRYLTLPMTKNGTKRNVPLSNKAISLLEKMKLKHNVNVFTVDAGVLSTLFRRARDKAEIKDLHFHDTRHQAITNLAKKLTVIQLARMVDHKDLKSLMIYYNETATELANLLN